jgi:hypothetical protein
MSHGSIDEIIYVAVRKRPIVEDDDIVDSVEICDNSVKVKQLKKKVDNTVYEHKKEYKYDYTFDEISTNADIFDEIIKEHLDNLFYKTNFSCIAYGQTGSGKTHTMFGHENVGLIQLSANYIFSKIHDMHMKIRVSCYEIYGKKIYDILNQPMTCPIRETGARKFKICGLKYITPKSSEELVRIIIKASRERKCGLSGENDRSSRSHAIFTIELIENNEEDRDREPIIVSTCSFIDLAGSEKGKKSINTDRKGFHENGDINRSILALKESIRAMCNGDKRIPFRNSVLTKAIRKMFILEGRSVMIGNISPEDYNIDETLNTLKYTSGVKYINKSNLIQRQRSLSEFPDIIRKPLVPTPPNSNISPDGFTNRRKLYGKVASIPSPPKEKKIGSGSPREKRLKRVTPVEPKMILPKIESRYVKVYKANESMELEEPPLDLPSVTIAESKEVSFDEGISLPEIEQKDIDIADKEVHNIVFDMETANKLQKHFRTTARCNNHHAELLGKLSVSPDMNEQSLLYKKLVKSLLRHQKELGTCIDKIIHHASGKFQSKPKSS